ncbi:MAG: LysR family transcriptional regulator [Clostridiales bacterium]|nr:LysR family transcriptional regulator [Clostridiales bacterium]
MNYEQLEVFISVVESGGFTRAAELMNTSHSTTSRNVAALEESLGICLLKREGRGVRMTPAGELLYSEGKELISQTRELEDKIRQADGTLTGSLSIASVNLRSDALADACRRFCAEYPDIVLGIHPRDLSEVFAQVESGRADIGVSFSYALPGDMENFEVRTIEKSSFCAVVPESHPLAGRKSAKIAELREYCYISVGDRRSRFTRAVEDAVLRERPAGEILMAPTLESLFLQVRCGNGISLVPRPMARLFGTGCAILDIEGENTDFGVDVFWTRGGNNSAIEMFRGFIEE